MDLEKMSREELLTLNKRIIERLQYLSRMKTRSALDRFEVGDLVGFQSEGRMIEGLVIRVNQKSLSVKTKDSHWTIHPQFVTKLPKRLSSNPGSSKPRAIELQFDPSKASEN
jgi:hypothetical protein